MTLDLFEDGAPGRIWRQELCPGAVLLHGFALEHQGGILAALDQITARAPLRHMVTPGGFRMSVAMSNCGDYGWVTDRSGYRYAALDHDSGLPWPAMPPELLALAQEAAASAGFANFVPDACLINCYQKGARMALHQDKDERDFGQPIVSLSFGLPAVFLFGGLQRADKPLRVLLEHGDAVVWGGPARLRYHGVMPLKEGWHPLLGAQRINLTFRKAV